MEITELERVVEAILFAAGESVPVERMVIATGCGVEHQAAAGGRHRGRQQVPSTCEISFQFQVDPENVK